MYSNASYHEASRTLSHAFFADLGTQRLGFLSVWCCSQDVHGLREHIDELSAKCQASRVDFHLRDACKPRSEVCMYVSVFCMSLLVWMDRYR